jgi:hypothetical protein
MSDAIRQADRLMAILASASPENGTAGFDESPLGRTYYVS